MVTQVGGLPFAYSDFVHTERGYGGAQIHIDIGSLVSMQPRPRQAATCIDNTGHFITYTRTILYIEHVSLFLDPYCIGHWKGCASGMEVVAHHLQIHRGASGQEADSESADDGLDALVGHNTTHVTRQASHSTACDGEAPTEGPIGSVNALTTGMRVDLVRLAVIMVPLA